MRNKSSATVKLSSLQTPSLMIGKYAVKAKIIAEVQTKKQIYIPFTHGDIRQSSMFTSHLTPVKPVEQTQVKLLTLSRHLPNETFQTYYY